MWTTKIADLLPIVFLNKKCDQRTRSRIVPPQKSFIENFASGWYLLQSLLCTDVICTH